MPSWKCFPFFHFLRSHPKGQCFDLPPFALICINCCRLAIKFSLLFPFFDLCFLLFTFLPFSTLSHWSAFFRRLASRPFTSMNALLQIGSCCENEGEHWAPLEMQLPPFCRHFFPFPSRHLLPRLEWRPDGLSWCHLPLAVTVPFPFSLHWMEYNLAKQNHCGFVPRSTLQHSELYSEPSMPFGLLRGSRHEEVTRVMSQLANKHADKSLFN